MDEHCKTCSCYADLMKLCCNEDSPFFGEEMYPDDYCHEWEEGQSYGQA